MTYLEKLMSAVKVDDELLTSCEAELLRGSLSKFFNHCLVMSSCPGHFLRGLRIFVTGVISGLTVFGAGIRRRNRWRISICTA